MAITPPLFKRTRYYGARTSNPSTVGLQQGSWWYRTDLHCWKWFNGSVIMDLPIYTETVTELFYISTGGGCDHKNMIAVELGEILIFVDINVINVEPPACDIYTPIHWVVDATTIGVTIGAAASTAGTTITVQAIFQGCVGG